MAINIGKALAKKLGILPVTLDPKSKKAKTPLRGFSLARINFSLPYPPSGNNFYTVARGRKIISTKGREWQEHAATICNDIEGHVTGKIGLLMWVFPPDNRRRDIGNVEKCVTDAAVKAGLLEDDSHIYDIRIRRGPVDHEGIGHVEVELLGELGSHAL